MAGESEVSIFLVKVDFLNVSTEGGGGEWNRIGVTVVINEMTRKGNE